MNKECIYMEDEILMKEKLIEQIKLEYKKIIKEKSHNRNISFKLLTKSVCILLSIPIVLIILPLIFGITELGSLPMLGIISGTTIPAYLGLFLIYEYNKTNNINRGLDNQIAFLEEQLRVEQENLKSMKKYKIEKNKSLAYSNKKISDNVIELKQLKEKLMLYYNCGYYQDRYQKYLEQGKLKSKLLKYYTKEQIKLAEEYLKNKVNTLKKVSQS